MPTGSVTRNSVDVRVKWARCRLAVTYSRSSTSHTTCWHTTHSRWLVVGDDESAGERWRWRSPQIQKFAPFIVKSACLFSVMHTACWLNSNCVKMMTDILNTFCWKMIKTQDFWLCSDTARLKPESQTTWPNYKWEQFCTQLFFDLTLAHSPLTVTLTMDPCITDRG